LIDYLRKNKDSLHPGVLEAWGKQGFREAGTWEEVFGKGELVDDWKGMSYLKPVEMLQELRGPFLHMANTVQCVLPLLVLKGEMQGRMLQTFHL